MSSSDVLVSREEKIPNQGTAEKLSPHSSKPEEEIELSSFEGDRKSEIIKMDQMDDEKPSKEQPKKERITYTIEELLDIKAGMRKWKYFDRRPSVLEEQFIEKNGLWNPETWSQSDSSRSGSPLVIDGKAVAADGKVLDLLGIKLEPKRDSFKLGCKVKTEKKPYADKTQRLTGRSSYQRNVPTNYRDGDSISASSHEFERMRKKDQKDQETFGSSHDKHDYVSYSDKQHYKRQHFGRSNVEESTPEWMTDEPLPKDDNLNFFNSRFEEEKKAFAAKAKKKKVRISPDVDAQIEQRSRSRTASVPSPSERGGKKSDGKKFDINEFMKDVEYFPPDMFTDDDDGVRSKFTRFFQNQERARSNSRSSSTRSPTGALIPDDVITGRPVSPAASHALFAPIQPAPALAPALVSAAANAHAIQSSNIASIIEKKRHEHLLENLHQTKREVRGSLSVQELEGSKASYPPSKPIQSNTQNDSESDRHSPGANAFNLLLQSMKNAGQLPEKPSPIVSGLPGHLLPHPPTRTSPVFEKLKRTLSRSPSPKDFAKAVSTVASIISSHPSIDNELAVLKHSRLPVENEEVASAIKPIARVNSPKTPKTPTHMSIRESASSPSSQMKKTPSNAFTPTSVLKKMHNERKDDPKSNDPNEKTNLDSQFMDVATTPDRSKPETGLSSNFMPFHSAPVTPKNYFNNTNIISTITSSVSAPGTPNPKAESDPPTIKRLPVHPPGMDKLDEQNVDSIFEKLKAAHQSEKVLMAPSAFKTVGTASAPKKVGVIGSGIRYPPEEHEDSINTHLSQMSIHPNGKVSPRQMSADPKLAPGNGVRHNQPTLDQMNFPNRHSPLSQMPKPQSQQQQLLQAQRMAQIQQAQLLQQQKLQEIAKLGRHGASNSPDSGAFRHKPDAEKPNRNFHPQQRLHQHNQPHQHFSFQQQQQQRQQMLSHQQRPYLPVNAFTPNQPRAPGQLPIPQMQQSQLPSFQSTYPQQSQVNPVNFAAQALVQQQLYNQAARARLVAQATLFQQQPQVMQAALMAQAALVRGQAQAQAAMMLNPRNIQAMAEQMGLRQPFNPNKQRKQGSNANTPTDVSPKESGVKENGEDNILSKWFSNDVLQQSKAPNSEDIKNVKVMSVEELEKGQR